jgi:hypothetical protein
MPPLPFFMTAIVSLICMKKGWPGTVSPRSFCLVALVFLFLSLRQEAFNGFTSGKISW